MTKTIRPILCHSVHWAQYRGDEFIPSATGWSSVPCDRCGYPVVLSSSSAVYLAVDAVPMCWDCAGPILVKQVLDDHPPVIIGTATAIKNVRDR